jgi:hypothetical protein
MKEGERGALSDSEMLFTLLTALVKRCDGKIVISEEEMDSVSKKDMVMLYYNKDTEEIILSTSLITEDTTVH